MDQSLKSQVKEFWERETCGTRYGTSGESLRYFEEIERSRYRLEPFILAFANFPVGNGKKVLEIGVGAGTDFANWVKHGAAASGTDLTQAAIDMTTQRLQAYGLATAEYTLEVADAEFLPFEPDCFDLVYSWGVLHHTPDTMQAFREAYRVLKPGGVLKAMIYHSPSWTGFMLWVMYGLLRGKPFVSQKEVAFHHLESPGTKVYTTSEAERFLNQIGFTNIRLSSKLGPGDMLSIDLSQKYKSGVFRLFRAVYPRWLVRLMGDRFGLCLLIEARKPCL